MLAPAILFFGSLTLIIGLFSLKVWEERSERKLAQETRERADSEAIRLKRALVSLQAKSELIPPLVTHASRFLVRELALGAAALARIAEHQAHRIADLVSYKRGFERREPTNEFLKQVGERDTTTDTTPLDEQK